MIRKRIGEKDKEWEVKNVIEMDNWQDYRFTQMMTQLQKELVEKENALARLQETI